MKSAEHYLFPKELRQNDVKISKVLFVGSCMAADYLRYFKGWYSETKFDYIQFNNVAELPDATAQELASYDFQLIQLPLRFLLSDRIVDFADFQRDEVHEDVIATAMQALGIALDNALKYNATHNVLTFVSNFIVPPTTAVAGLANQGTSRDLCFLVRELNRELGLRLQGRSNVFLIDAENIAGVIGKRYFFDDAIVFFGHGGFWFPDWNNNELDRIEVVPHIEELTPSHLEQYMRSFWDQLQYNYRVIRQADQVKLVIFDLDDTLWRGQIAEHYNDANNRPMYFGWPLGLSEAIHHLRARGILVAICSKNNEETVRTLWDRAAPEGWVSFDDFVTTEINWSPKVENVGKIMQRLNLTPRSVVFVDDNPVERESVRLAYPHIRVLGADPFSTRRILLSAPETQVATVTRESADRATMLKKAQHREVERASMSRGDFLKGLRCKVTFGEVNRSSDPRFARCAELINKTNQFNTTGRRWSTGELEQFFAEGGCLICFNVDDKFTQYGLVGVIIYKDGQFVQFVMSCRVLGLEIETTALRYAMNRFAARTTSFQALDTETELNKVSRGVFAKCGFHQVPDGSRVWALDHYSRVEYAAHLTVVEEEVALA